MYEALQVKKLSKKNYNLSLVGLMGSGKSTTGNYIAENTNLKFEDTDIAIVKKYNKTVSEIFKTEGEKSFRDKETKTLDSLLKRPNTVIACGGGIVLKPENRDMLARRTCVIWLSASPQQVIARMKPGSRPLLQVEDPLAKAKELFVERAHLYASVADVMINAENYTTEQIASKIYEEIDTAFGN
jgi:shikimate kinase